MARIALCAVLALVVLEVLVQAAPRYRPDMRELVPDSLETERDRQENELRETLRDQEGQEEEERGSGREALEERGSGREALEERGSGREAREEALEEAMMLQKLEARVKAALERDTDFSF